MSGGFVASAVVLPGLVWRDDDMFKAGRIRGTNIPKLLIRNLCRTRNELEPDKVWNKDDFKKVFGAKDWRR